MKKDDVKAEIIRLKNLIFEYKEKEDIDEINLSIKYWNWVLNKKEHWGE